MEIIDVENWNRKKQYDWFKSFSNPCYGITKKMNVTNLIKYTKETKTSFFVNMLYIVVKGLNTVEEMKMRFENNIPVKYDELNPAYTVMTDCGSFENVRHEFIEDYKEFYKLAKKYIEKTKHLTKLSNESYNSNNKYNDYYITCLPWLDFASMTHPIPDDIHSSSVPRICWGKYHQINNEYYIDLNITVSHIFVDGLALCTVFNNIQDLLIKCKFE